MGIDEMCAFQSEITGGFFYDSLASIAQRIPLRTVLDIGAATGDGSTKALLQGLAANSSTATLFAIEAAPVNYEQLAHRYAGNDQVRPYFVASVNLNDYPSEEDIINFYNTQPTNLNIGETNLNNWPLDLVLSWLRNEITFLKTTPIRQDGIALIKQENNITYFDMVLIDGSEFVGTSELCQVYGAKVLALDDINTYKNAYNYRFLRQDPHYEPVVVDRLYRNGFAIFVRRQ